MFLKGWSLPNGRQVAPRAAPWSPVALKIPFFPSSVSLMFFHQILGSDLGDPGSGNPTWEGRRVQVNIDFFMNIGAGAQVLTTFGTFGFPGPAEKDITSGNIVSQLTLSQLR